MKGGTQAKFLAQKIYEFFGLFFSCLPEMDLCCLLFTAPPAGIKWVLPFWEQKCYCSRGFCSPFVTGSLQGMPCFQGSSGRSWLFVKACLLLLCFIILLKKKIHLATPGLNCSMRTLSCLGPLYQEPGLPGKSLPGASLT